MKKLLLFAFIALTAFALAGCAKGGPLKSNSAIALVNGQPITLADFNLMYEYDSANKNASILGVRISKMRYLEGLIAMEVLYQEALKKKIQNDKDLRQLIELSKKLAAKKILVEKLMQNEILKDVSVSDQTVQKFYDDNKESKLFPELQFSEERARLSQIVLNSKEEIDKIYAELKAGTGFAELANKRSIAPNRSSGGDMGYVAKIFYGSEFDAVSTKLKPGEFSEPFKSGKFYQIIKSYGKASAGPKPYEEVKDDIKAMLQRRNSYIKQQEYVENLMLKAKIERNEAILKNEPSESGLSPLKENTKLQNPNSK